MPQGKVFESPAAAIHDIPDGAIIMFGGFVTAGTPPARRNLVRRLG